MAAAKPTSKPTKKKKLIVFGDDSWPETEKKRRE
jgi:hypothetical protein